MAAPVKITWDFDDDEDLTELKSNLEHLTKTVFDNRENTEEIQDINVTAIVIGVAAFLTVTALVLLVE